jgi:polyketide cyclase/dehydrase/lipid transport protein
MSRIDVSVTVDCRADPAVIFGLLKDGSTWPQWAMFDSFELEQPGRHETYGVGAIRVFSTKVSRSREEITELIPDRKLAYTLLSGFPLRDYRAEVELLQTSRGKTTIGWRASFDPKYFGTGWFWRLFIKAVIATTAKQLAADAERRRRLAKTI